MPEEEIRQASGAAMQMGEYLAALVAARRVRPGDDLLSDLVAGEDPDGRMDEMELLSTLALLLVAGHETTVNLISNGTLALLRNPDVLDRLRREATRDARQREAAHPHHPGGRRGRRRDHP